MGLSSWMKNIAYRLQKGETVTFHPRGHSMTGIVNDGDRVTLIPSSTAEVGDVVLCKVKGIYRLHKVGAIDSKGRYRIENAKGHVNGWTKQIFGVVTSIGEDK